MTTQADNCNDLLSATWPEKKLIPYMELRCISSLSALRIDSNYRCRALSRRYHLRRRLSEKRSQSDESPDEFHPLSQH